MTIARFNKNFVANLVDELYESRTKEFQTAETGSEDQKRAWGAMQGLEWVSAGFDLKVTGPGHRARFVDADGKPEKLTKKNLANRLWGEAERLRKECGFTTQTGYAQVMGLGSFLNRSYGQWDILCHLFYELDLGDHVTV